MKLIVGLGNIGKEYENTRHNVGFMMVDKIADSFGLIFNKKKFQGSYCEFIYHGEKVILLKPEKYMNLSGEVVSAYMNFFKISTDDILIFSDDLDMPLGKIKIKYKGSSGGHNGLKNIALNIETENFKRIKIGISNNKQIDTKDYVLGKFKGDDWKVLTDSYNKVLDIVENFISKDVNTLKQIYSNKNN